MHNLAEGLAEVTTSPQQTGIVEMLVCRPDIGQRVEVEEATFDIANGMIGDNWKTRGSRQTTDGSAHPGMQITLMNSRMIALIAGSRDRWALAGDQLFVDFDLSSTNLPIGQRLIIGEVILEVSEIPHNGCAKFTERFGSEATRLVNSPEGREQRRRGINARIIQSGKIRTGDRIIKVDESH